MTKTINTLIIIAMIALVATFIISAISLQSKTDKVLTSYSARREELAARQQQIQDMIVTLNSTLQSEIERQQNISAQLGIQFNDTISAPKIVANKTSPSISTPTIPTPPVVVKKPVVTRAS
jgi:hypothetical protein